MSKNDHNVRVLKVYPGDNITKTIEKAIKMASNSFCLTRIIQFEFNGVTVQVNCNSCPALIYRDWNRCLSGCTTGVVGPHPKAVLSKKELESDAKIHAEKNEKRKIAKAKRDAEFAEAKKAFDLKMAQCPPMAFCDEEKWQAALSNKADGYGAAIFSYAKNWARMMQAEMAKGKTVAEVAETTSREADIEGITGYMYGYAVYLLSDLWKHGDALRQWQNAKYGVSEDSKGVVNPAVLIISSKPA